MEEAAGHDAMERMGVKGRLLTLQKSCLTKVGGFLLRSPEHPRWQTNACSKSINLVFSLKRMPHLERCLWLKFGATRAELANARVEINKFCVVAKLVAEEQQATLIRVREEGQGELDSLKAATLQRETAMP